MTYLTFVLNFFHIIISLHTFLQCYHTFLWTCCILVTTFHENFDFHLISDLMIKSKSQMDIFMRKVSFYLHVDYYICTRNYWNLNHQENVSTFKLIWQNFVEIWKSINEMLIYLSRFVSKILLKIEVEKYWRFCEGSWRWCLKNIEDFVKEIGKKTWKS